MSGIQIVVDASGVLTSSSYTSGPTGLVIPDTVTRIDDNAFDVLSVQNVLTSVTIPSSVTYIGESAFIYCSSLASINIPDSVIFIRDTAFYQCASLASITFLRPRSPFSSGLTFLGLDCFRDAGFSLTNYRSISNMLNMGYTTSVLTMAGFDSDVITTALANRGIVITVSDLGVLTGYTYSAGPKDLVIPTYVASIASNALKNCPLTSVNIPSSVTSIGDAAFQGCSSLTSINIPSGVTSIESNAFLGCSLLTSVTLQRLSSQVLTTLKPNCFLNVGFTTTNYQSVSDMYNQGYTRDNVSVAGISSNIIDLVFPGGIQITIVDNIITSSSYISSPADLVIPDTVTSIGSNAFKDLNVLTSVTIPSRVTSIGASAFQGCSSLTSITIPSSVTSIGASAFQSCSLLTSITIPSSVTTIASSAFQGCSSLTSVTFLGSSVTSIASSAFQGCSSLTSITIPSSVTSIGASAFQGCSSLTSITIPSSVTSIGASAFQGCSSLTSTTISSSVTSIGSSAFQGCSSLTSITIPSSVTSIGASAFQGCSLLVSITLQRLKSQELTTFGSNCFLNTGITTTCILTLYNQGYTRYNLIKSGIPTNVVDEVIATQDGLVNITLYYYNADYFG